jgi:hypothetical protein
MFKRLRVKPEPTPSVDISVSQLIGDASLPVTIKALNSLPENPKLRLYRTLIPLQVLAGFDINPRTWKNSDKLQQVKLEAEAGRDKVKIRAWHGKASPNTFPLSGERLMTQFEMMPSTVFDSTGRSSR